ncbi:MAG: hypothetical protein ACREIW_11355 [Chthoniobacterales bacterium]
MKLFHCRTVKLDLAHAILPLVTLFVSVASAGQVDSRFDGKWIGVETFKYRSYASAPRLLTYYLRSTTVIGIADSGTMFGVLSGFAPGRYEVSPKSDGRTLIFQQPNLNGPIIYLGRKRCALKLSSDGNTLKEEGFAILNRGLTAEVWATFRRQGK